MLKKLSWIGMIAVTMGILNGCPTDDKTVTPEDPDEPSLVLEEGDRWVYFWSAEKVSSHQDGTGDYDLFTGQFVLWLGPSKMIEGVKMYTLYIDGKSGEGNLDFAPRWNWLGVTGTGTLVASIDGVTHQTIYNETTRSWTGGGYFLEYPDDQTVVAQSDYFQGEYNNVDAVAITSDVSEGGCQYFPEVGQTLCDGDPQSIDEGEYYKDGVGVIGYKYRYSETFSGGGFSSYFTRTYVVELIETSLEATDGTVFNKPPWVEVAPMNTPRYDHACVVLEGKIYAIGGFTTGDYALSSVEIFDPATNSWSYGTAMPITMARHEAEVVNGTIYVFPLGGGGSVWYYAPADDQWWTGPRLPYDDLAHGSAVLTGSPTVAIITPNGASSGALRVYYYDTETWEWNQGTSLQWTDHRWFAVSEFIEQSESGLEAYLYVVGGYQPAFRKAYDSALRYEAVGQYWTTHVGTMNDPRYAAAAVTHGSDIIALGGQNIRRTLRTVERLSHYNQAWYEMPSMMTPRRNLDAVMLNGIIYAIGGKSGDNVFSSVEVYRPE